MDKPNYYAVIPAEIRYADNLTEFQKLLYGELTALAQKNGFAFPSNKYLANLYNKHETYISQVLTDMNTKGYIDIFVNLKEGNSRKIYVGGIQKNLKRSLEKPKDPSLEKPKGNNTSINNNNNKDFSCEKSLRYEEVKNTYKSKHQLADQKGIQLKRTPRTQKQTDALDYLRWVNYYREKAQEIHGMQFFLVNDESRNKAVRKLIIRAGKEANLKDLIDWWLDGAGEWAGYEPENCFATKMIERFVNRKKTENAKREPIQIVGPHKFYTKEEVLNAEKQGIIKWDYQKDKWQLNN